MECEELEMKGGKTRSGARDNSYGPALLGGRGATLVGLNDPMSWKVPGGMDDGKLDGSSYGHSS